MIEDQFVSFLFSFAYDAAQYNDCKQMDLLKIESSFVLKLKYTEVTNAKFYFYLLTI